MTSISIFGLGYVGAVTAACLAKQGYTIIGVDPNPVKVKALADAHSPIVEAQVDELVAEAARAGRVRATQEAETAIAESDISFISVGTPSLRTGKLDLSHVQQVCMEIGAALRQKKAFHWIVLRSTVLPGTTDQLVIPALEQASGKRCGTDFGVCFNPEFLREGTAVADFFEPPFTIVGSGEGASIEPIRELYAWAPGKFYTTSTATAEMVKYVCNAFHALKVSFANEIGSLGSELNVDAKEVMEIFRSDRRLNISEAYLTPGFAFGGSCLPKDLRALTYRAKELDLNLPLLESILPSNEEHIDRAIEAVLRTGKKKIAVLGLSFKAGTDDLRESPMVHVVKRLLGEGCALQIWDDKVALGQLIGSNRQFIQEVIPHIGLLLHPDLQEVIEPAEVILLGTRSISKETILKGLRDDQLLVDVVNCPRGERAALAITAAVS